MTDIQIRLKEIDEKIDMLNEEKYQLQRENSQYFIGVVGIGNGDYWDEYYYRLGFITEEEAVKWRDKQESYEGVCECHYFSVSEEKYFSYDCLFALSKAINVISNLRYKAHGQYFSEDILKKYKEDYKNLGISLGAFNELTMSYKHMGEYV